MFTIMTLRRLCQRKSDSKCKTKVRSKVESLSTSSRVSLEISRNRWPFREVSLLSFKASNHKLTSPTNWVMSIKSSCPKEWCNSRTLQLNLKDSSNSRYQPKHSTILTNSYSRNSKGKATIRAKCRHSKNHSKSRTRDRWQERKDSREYNTIALGCLTILRSSTLRTQEISLKTIISFSSQETSQCR